jgi:4-diphosphocytidyl-2C-methyl-D-erythritol kinase
VYELFDELEPEARLRAEAVATLASAPSRLAPDAPFNDLAAAALRCAPELERHLRDFAALAERPAHVTGSGSSLFVVADSQMHAGALAAAAEARLGLPAVAVQTYSTVHAHAASR